MRGGKASLDPQASAFTLGRILPFVVHSGLKTKTITGQWGKCVGYQLIRLYIEEVSEWGEGESEGRAGDVQRASQQPSWVV